MEFRGLKVQKSSFLLFLAQKRKNAPKVQFCGFRVENMILEFVLQRLGAKRKIITFCRFISRNNVILQIANSTWDHFIIFRKKVRIMHFRRVGIRYTAAEKAVTTLPKTDLPRKMWNSSALCAFGCQNRNLWPKCCFADFGCHLRSTCFFLKDH